MSDITINNNENQEDNQKTTPVMKSLSEPNDSSLALSGEIFSTWLGWRDSNPRMPGPEPGALPLGDIPITFPTIAKKPAGFKIFCRLSRSRRPDISPQMPSLPLPRPLRQNSPSQPQMPCQITQYRPRQSS